MSEGNGHLCLFFTMSALVEEGKRTPVALVYGESPCGERNRTPVVLHGESPSGEGNRTPVSLLHGESICEGGESDTLCLFLAVSLLVGRGIGHQCLLFTVMSPLVSEPAGNLSHPLPRADGIGKDDRTHAAEDPNG